MGDVEVFARDAVEVIAGQRLFRHEGDGVHDAVEAVPVLAEIDEQLVDFFVAADVAGEHQARSRIRWPGSATRSLTFSPW